MNLENVPCRFGCKDPAVGLYWMPRGCICFTDQVQALCAQHVETCEPLESMENIVQAAIPTGLTVEVVTTYGIERPVLLWPVRAEKGET